MRRWAFGILSGLSLLLCVAVCVLWVRSYWVCDGVYHGTDLIVEGDAERVSYRTVHSYRGRVAALSLKASAVRGSITHNTPVGWGRHSFVPRPEDRDAFGRGTVAGFGFVLRSDHHDVIAITLPHWVLTLTLSLLPACWTMGYLRRRRRGAAGLCPACGYDLRASPGPCPECGLAAANAPA